MSFVWPLALVGLLAVPLLAWWYLGEQPEQCQRPDEAHGEVKRAGRAASVALAVTVPAPR